MVSADLLIVLALAGVSQMEAIEVHINSHGSLGANASVKKNLVRSEPRACIDLTGDYAISRQNGGSSGATLSHTGHWGCSGTGTIIGPPDHTISYHVDVKRNRFVIDSPFPPQYGSISQDPMTMTMVNGDTWSRKAFEYYVAGIQGCALGPLEQPPGTMCAQTARQIQAPQFGDMVVLANEAEPDQCFNPHQEFPGIPEVCYNVNIHKCSHGQVGEPSLALDVLCEDTDNVVCQNFKDSACGPQLLDKANISTKNEQEVLGRPHWRLVLAFKKFLLKRR